MLPPMADHPFDADYYARYYDDPNTRVASAESTGRLARFVCAYLAYLEVEVESVLEFGCGLGWWREPLREAYPAASYVGVELSEHLCEVHGWTRGSVVDYEHHEPVDLVVCQGVLQYLDDKQARAAIANLAHHAGSALYLEALTRGDWREVCDRERTDGEVHLRTLSWYRRALSPHFRSCGGGLFVSRASSVALFELEQGWT